MEIWDEVMAVAVESGFTGRTPVGGWADNPMQATVVLAAGERRVNERPRVTGLDQHASMTVDNA